MKHMGLVSGVPIPSVAPCTQRSPPCGYRSPPRRTCPEPELEKNIHTPASKVHTSSSQYPGFQSQRTGRTPRTLFDKQYMFFCRWGQSLWTKQMQRQWQCSSNSNVHSKKTSINEEHRRNMFQERCGVVRRQKGAGALLSTEGLDAVVQGSDLRTQRLDGTLGVLQKTAICFTNMSFVNRTMLIACFMCVSLGNGCNISSWHKVYYKLCKTRYVDKPRSQCTDTYIYIYIYIYTW